MPFESKDVGSVTVKTPRGEVVVRIGDLLVARGPRRLIGEPDINGVIVKIYSRTGVAVQEEKYKSHEFPTTGVNIERSCGWVSLKINDEEIV